MGRCEGDDENKRLNDGTMGAIMLSRGGEVRRSEGEDKGETRARTTRMMTTRGSMTVQCVQSRTYCTITEFEWGGARVRG